MRGKKWLFIAFLLGWLAAYLMPPQAVSRKLRGASA